MTDAGSITSFPFVSQSDLRKAAIICHRNADADAYLSAFALSFLIKNLAPRCFVVIVTPQGMTTLTERLSRKFAHKTVTDTEEDYNLFVAVDVGDTELLKNWLGKMEDSKGVKVLVDHHPLRDTGVYQHVIVDESATSAGEVVYRLFKAKKVTPEAKVAQALLEAIVFDSSHLAIAGEGGLRTAVALIDAGANLAQARKDLRAEPDYGEVLARLKGAQRLKISRLGEWVLASSRVGSFQAHVARSLILLGADVAVVGGDTDDETRVSLRSTQRFYDSTNLHLGTQVAEKLGNALGGHGGGHATAASFSCKVDEDEAMTRTLKAIAQLVGSDLTDV